MWSANVVLHVFANQFHARMFRTGNVSPRPEGAREIAEFFDFGGHRPPILTESGRPGRSDRASPRSPRFLLAEPDARRVRAGRPLSLPDFHIADSRRAPSGRRFAPERRGEFRHVRHRAITRYWRSDADRPAPSSSVSPAGSHRLGTVPGDEELLLGRVAVDCRAGLALCAFWNAR